MNFGAFIRLIQGNRRPNCFRNPVSLLSSSNLRLQLGNVKAAVEPLEAGVLTET